MDDGAPIEDEHATHRPIATRPHHGARAEAGQPRGPAQLVRTVGRDLLEPGDHARRILGLGEHLERAIGHSTMLAKVAVDPGAQRGGLAHVEHGAIATEHSIHAGDLGQGQALVPIKGKGTLPSWAWCNARRKGSSKRA